ncbi:uncharacterized protein LOC111261761 isoform X2 [Varroa jacobsoni]|uniref:uncharacterized protein LOC111261761 isoform X2 n=1 Tax=Varroa jacobsoni TaxID=62625 RepID=UPI000BF422CC|nr:uncharacterized protein LOC111261761 isoform X2 [Varroa jacobsoni]
MYSSSRSKDGCVPINQSILSISSFSEPTETTLSRRNKVLKLTGAQRNNEAVIPILELPYHIVSTLWSRIGSGTILPGMTPMGSRSLSTGLFAGVISRILNIDLINSYFNALAIDEKCRERAACEMGAYVIHQNQYAAPILHDVFKNLFEQTTKYWTHMQRGIKGGVCHNYYRSCVSEFFMKR